MELKKLDNGNFDLLVTIAWAEVEKAYQKELEHEVEHAELDGFRKGKAPKEMVEARLDRSKLYTKALQNILPDLYAKGVKDNALQPILYPAIQIIKGQENEDWVIKFTACEAPVVTLPDYKKGIAGLKTDKDNKMGQILDYLAKEATVVLPEMLIDEEVSHRLSNLADNITRLGLNTEKYLASKKLTIDDHNKKVRDEALVDLKVEFALGEIQRLEKLESRQKTLDFLTSLV
jgi:FKBP-type peptidyl-prolyl cis-trans isomerase (trigger factor)